jgi:hypothetical protein
MAFVTLSVVSTLRNSLAISRTNSYMSERTPLLSGTVNGNGPSSVSVSLPSRRDVESVIPDKGERIKVAEVLGALEAGKLP